MEKITSLSEDAANLASARAKRAQILDGVQAASGLADCAGLQTEDLFEALAAGREKTDPDFYTFKIMQYLYSAIPFGKYGRWFVPILLVYGLYKAAEKATELIAAGFASLKSSAFYQSLNTMVGGILPDERVAHFGSGMGAGIDTESLQIGLMSVAPPFVSMVVMNQIRRESTPSTNGGSGSAVTASTASSAASAPATKSIKQIAAEKLLGFELPVGTLDARRMARDRIVRDAGNSSHVSGVARIRKGNY